MPDKLISSLTEATSIADDDWLLMENAAGNSRKFKGQVLKLGIGKKGADIASASTTDLSAATGEMVDVTGTTTITALGTLDAGYRRIVRFTGILTLTHNATSLILPGGVNITTANGDIAQFVSLGSGNWVCVNYQFAALGTTTALCSADLSTTTTYQDVSGVSMSLTAGTYLLLGTATVVVNSGGANTITVKLYNQSDSTDLVASAASPAGNGYYDNIQLSYMATLAATKTIRMAAVQNNGTGGAVKRYGDAPAPSPVSIPGTYLRAIRIG